VSAAADPRECPYVGLDPFERAHADYFFGRRRESRIIADHVLARPVTVLYGPSGVGKSSILNVGVPAALRQIAEAEREQAEPGQPNAAAAGAEGTDGDFIVRWLRDWQDPDKARAVLAGWLAEPADRPVLLILDQFEEYFLYRDRLGMSALDRALGDLAARRDLRVHLLFGVRDDALYQLDRLRAVVPGILETTIELRGLGDGGVRDAIVGPIERYNEQYRDKDSAIVVEDALVATLIRELKRADAASGKGRAMPGEGRRIELPYLQLALIKLWAAEGGAAASALREATLIDRLGGVGRIVRDHVNGVLGKLPADQQALCARLFDRLVTAIGGKIAYPTAALAAPAVVGPNVSEQTVNAVLNKLTGREERILKPVMTDGGDGFELFHDVLGLPVLEWKRSLEEAALARQARRRLRRVRAIVAVLLAVIVAGVAAWWNQGWLADQIYAFRNVHALSAGQERALKPGDTFQECNNCPNMMVVPAGSFTMGSPASEPGRDSDEGPQHTVTIAQQFAVGQFELTFDQWDACVADRGCRGYSPIDAFWGRGRRPVIYVSSDDAQSYVAWLSKITGKSYRVLSEAEYEYAARAGSTTAYPWGPDIKLNGVAMANCVDCGSQWDGKQTAPVGSFPPNKFGLYDMVGNVWEWTEDCYHDSYNGAPADGSAWTGGACTCPVLTNTTCRVVRGGSWSYNPQNLRSANRVVITAGSRSNILGFRVGRTLLTP
jgi:formylglycine-generating enzyme required for sulfatase activity